MPLTVTQLARACHLARSTVLYYESIGLLARPRRTPGNYRAYTEKDLGRLRQICAYRDAGLELGDIRSILDAPHTEAAAVLRRRLLELSAGRAARPVCAPGTKDVKPMKAYSCPQSYKASSLRPWFRWTSEARSTSPSCAVSSPG